MDEYSTTATEDKEAAVISDTEEEDSDETLDGSPRITLPPEVWANIINYLQYDSLISCASTSRTILNDALPLVTTLFIDKASHLSAGIVSNNLRDIRNVIISNLVYKDRYTEFIFDEEIATNAVFFLSKFSHLESVTFWGMCWNELYPLRFTNINEDQRGSAYHLLDSFSGAFLGRHIPHNLQIKGLCCPNRTPSSNCKSCKRICRNFPFERILDIESCLSYASMKETIESRRGGRDYLHSETRFMQLLGTGHAILNGRAKSASSGLYIIGYDDWVEDYIKGFVESSQMDVTKLNQEDVVKAIKKQYPDNTSVYLSEQTFDHLKTTIGLPISDELLDPRATRVENLDRMVKDVMEETDSLQKSLDQMHRLIKKQDPPIQRVLESGVLPKLVGFLQRDDEYDLQLAVTRILNSIMTEEINHAGEVVELGAISPLVHLLDSSHIEISQSTARALGNIIQCNQKHRDLVLQSRVMQPLLKLLEDHQMVKSSVRAYIRLLALLCDGKKPRPDFNLVRPSLQVLKKLLLSTDDVKVTETSCRTLFYLSDGPNENIQAVIDDALDDTGIRHLVELLEHRNTTVQRLALKTLGNVVTGNDSQTQLIIDNNVLPYLLVLLSSSKKANVKEACWAISNITAGTEDQIQAVFDSGIFPKVFPLLNHEDSGVRREVSWAIKNAIQGGNTKQVKDMVNQECIPHLLDLLGTIKEDKIGVVVILNVLEALENVGSVEDKDEMNTMVSYVDADGLSKIEELQHHNDDGIRVVSTSIIETYFYQNIIAMPQYKHKSFEEVRLEDYMAGNKGTKEQAPLNTDTESIERVKNVLDSLEGKIP